MNNPKVSVIVPIYNTEAYISRCARSLFEQTLDDIEFIFVDDCTPDNSMNILSCEIEKYRHRFVEKRYKVRLERMPSNSGQAAVRQHGIKVATGDFIIHCDSDDWVDKYYCESLWEKAVNDNLDLVMCDYYRSDGVKSLVYNSSNKDFNSHEAILGYLFSGYISTAVWNKLVKREICKYKDLIFPEHNMWEDFVLNIQFFYYAKKIGYVKQPLYYYYDNPKSICSSSIDNKMKQIIANSKIILSFIYSKQIFNYEDTETILFKYYSRSELALLVNKSKYRKEWRNLYPEINTRFLIEQDISFREKIKFICLYIGIYPILIKLKKHFSHYYFHILIMMYIVKVHNYG